MKILATLAVIWILLTVAFNIVYYVVNKECKSKGGSVINRGQFLNNQYECVKTDVIEL